MTCWLSGERSLTFGLLVFLLIFGENIDYGYSLEPPYLGGSKEYPESMSWVNEEIKCIPL